ncbi:MAG: hypothetical protein GXP54_07855 [Deltaproteobacteria bacterium]|nr:hypothetical protein [Deltaproteobacteria bacterium]
MKRISAALMLALACNVAEAPPAADSVDVETMDDVAVLDATEAGADLPIETDVPSEAVDSVQPDIPKTCESVLDDWQCIKQSGCPDWAACLGVGACQEPPCWGLCDDYPGECLPKLVKTLCESNDDCEAGDLCVGRVMNDDGSVRVPGLCRKRPFDGACWEDSHCAPGKHCAGERVQRPGVLCLGPESYGKCVDAAPAGKCWETDDCPKGQVCDGVTWCAPDEAGCGADGTGECIQDSVGGCVEDDDCQDDPAGNFCTGAYTCPKAICSIENVKGFCSGPPGFGGCWEDSDCGPEYVCRASLTCAPGTLCAAGYAHVGQCGEPPKEGEGVAVALAATSVEIGVPFWITLLNQGPATIFVDPCSAMILQRRKGDTQNWIDWQVEVKHDSCVDPDVSTAFLAIPPGNGALFKGEMGELDAGTFRVETVYQVGCVQGVPNPTCRTNALKVDSLEFDSNPPGQSDAR